MSIIVLLTANDNKKLSYHREVGQLCLSLKPWNVA